MSSPTKEELPKIDNGLKNELVSGLKLKPTETQEKVVLPDKTVIEQEKNEQKLMKSIETFSTDKLNHANTDVKNPLPTKEEIEAEKKAVQGGDA